MIRTSVPEATIDKYGNLGRPKHHVRPPPEAGQRLRVNPVSQASGVKKASESQLWSGVSGPLPLHTRSDFWVASPRIRFRIASNPVAGRWPAAAPLHQSRCYAWQFVARCAAAVVVPTVRRLGKPAPSSRVLVENLGDSDRPRRRRVFESVQQAADYPVASFSQPWWQSLRRAGRSSRGCCVASTTARPFERPSRIMVWTALKSATR